jgi:hypothetical protein
VCIHALESISLGLTVIRSTSSTSLSTYAPEYRTECSREEYESDWCRLLISIGAAWHSIDQPFLRHFVQKHIPNRPSLPHSDVLSGCILDHEYDLVVSSWRQHTSGKFASAQSDGWKNIAHRHLLATIMMICGKVCVHRSFLSSD